MQRHLSRIIRKIKGSPVASEPTFTRRQRSKAPNGDNPVLKSGAINRRDILLGGTTLAAAFAIVSSDNTLNVAQAQQASGSQQQKPNVVFILSDNVGYGDLGSYGGGELRGAPTPRIDQLASEGLRLTQFLVEPACTPSRAALMTGQYSIGTLPLMWTRWS